MPATGSLFIWRIPADAAARSYGGQVTARPAVLMPGIAAAQAVGTARLRRMRTSLPMSVKPSALIIYTCAVARVDMA